MTVNNAEGTYEFVWMVWYGKALGKSGGQRMVLDQIY